MKQSEGVKAYGYTDRTASDRKHGMTLDELALCVNAAIEQGIDGSSIPEIVVTWRSSIKRIKITGPVHIAESVLRGDQDE